MWRIRHTAASILVLLAATPLACSDRVAEPDPENVDSCERFSNLCELSDQDLRIRVGGAIEEAGTYRITASQENLVLPRWGGSDGGTVAVDVRAGTATADLRRTGDGQYAVVLDGDTFFKRDTCSTWARIQDGEDVLAPFILTPDDLAQSHVLRTVSLGPTSATVEVELAGLGDVMLEIDDQTGRPQRLWSETLTNSGKSLEWNFHGWGEPVSIPDVSADRTGGPGGNPC